MDSYLIDSWSVFLRLLIVRFVIVEILVWLCL